MFKCVFAIVVIVILEYFHQTLAIVPTEGKKIGDFGCEFKSFIQKELHQIRDVTYNVNHLKFSLKYLQSEYEEHADIIINLRNKEEYLGKVLNRFSLLKRTARTWPSVIKTFSSLAGSLSLMKKPGEFLRKFNHKWYSSKLNEIYDLATGIRGLSRLQDVYNITADTIVSGQMNNVLGNFNFSSCDCFEFAKYYCLKQINFHHCHQWTEITFKILNNSDDCRIFDNDELFEVLFSSKYFMKDVNASNVVLQQILMHHPSFTPTNLNLFNFSMAGKDSKTNEETHIFTKKISGLDNLINEEYKEENGRFIARWNLSETDLTLLELCDYPAVYNSTSNLLKCRYVHYNDPKLIIGPFKMEEFHIDPPVLMFHDVISDSEIYQMMDIGNKYMVPATVYAGPSDAGDSSSSLYSEVRTNEHAWVLDRESSISAVLSKRASLLTNWDSQFAEPNQIARYGPAGEFLLHTDGLTEDLSAQQPYFADYSVVMFYLNEVRNGGHTIFPALNVSIAPVRGAAVAWFNIKPDGSPDDDSLHAGCPVIQGYKWVINKWFNRRYQHFPKCTQRKNSSFRYFYL